VVIRALGRSYSVTDYELDAVDRGILHALQENARDATIEGMGEMVDVSASTVRNRIEAMEGAGIIEGYHPQINYAKAGYDLHVLYLCQVPTGEREALAEGILDVTGTVQVHELLDSEQNITVEAVARDSEHLATIHDSLIDIGVSIRSTEHVRTAYVQPFDHFGASLDGE
jgi:DNA-binding Lrp family transcriptional regulator